MPLLSQTRFPYAWLAFQQLFGGTPDKGRLALERYRGQSRVLEVGCSAGNLTSHFLVFPGVTYIGVDIDAGAINLARRRFASNSNVRFLLLPLAELAMQESRFDYVLFAGVLHHVDDSAAIQLIRSGLTLLASDGCIVVSEPEKLQHTDSVLMRLFYRLEQGQHLRSGEALARLIEAAGARIIFRAGRLVGPGISARPKVARFTLMEAVPAVREM